MNKKLLHRFFDGQASLEEESLVRQWVEASEANFSAFMHERKLFDTLLLGNAEAAGRRKTRIFLAPWWVAGAAASVVLLLIVSGIFFMRDAEESYNTILVPPGQRINLILSDNSNVWLNANTKFRYPGEFSKKNRAVYLDGEAFFDVAENTKKPFVVKTEQGAVRVTGTVFNVEAYSRFGSFETSLFDGGVEIYRDEVKLASLKPNEKSVLENGKITISTIEDTDEYLWKNGLIAFSDKKLEEILHSLEKYFDIHIRINTDKLPQHTYTGKFRQADGVDYALRVLQKSIKFTYQRDDNAPVIYIN